MTREEKYDLVNQSQTLNELAYIIESFADSDGFIQGRTRKFDAKKMADCCRNYNLEIHNSLTREFGIRQQAMCIIFYK